MLRIFSRGLEKQMSDIDVLPAPELTLPATAKGKWQREREAFTKMHAELLRKHRQQYVAIHEGKVVASGGDKVQVALQAYRQHGHIPIYVGLVSEEPPPPARLPSPRNPLN
jgi:nicotinamide riboside kinase